MGSHWSIHPSGEIHYYSSNGTKVTLTQAGFKLLGGEKLKDKALASVKQSDSDSKNSN